MSDVPPPEVIEAIENGTTRVVRYAKIYESDNETLWNPDGQPQRPVMIDGKVTVDYSRKERRMFNLTISNDDGRIRLGPDGGLWYNHIIKLYRGVRYAKKNQNPSIVIIEADDQASAYKHKQMFSTIGFGDTTVRLKISSFSEVADYDIIVSAMSHSAPAKAQVLVDAYSAGKAVISMGLQNDPSTVPLIANGVQAETQTFAIEPVSYDTPVAGGWGSENAGVYPGYRPTEAALGAVVVATRGDGYTFPMAILKEGSNDGRWFHYQLPSVGAEGRKLFRNAVKWLRDYQPFAEWTTQLGEFMIDKLNEKNFPGTISVTGRDFTKKCIKSKLERSMSFPAGTSVEQLIRALAANAGIKKFALPGTDVMLSSSMELERGTERWDVMKKAADSVGYELFFSNSGHLTMRKYRDPTLSPIYFTFKTGPNGNLASLDKSIHDERLYNHIVVTGENESQDGAEVLLPYFGEAKNENPSSPTSIEAIGDRAFFFTSTFFTSDEQCQELAESWLKIHALETFEFRWESLNYPWMDVGEVVEVIDPKRFSIDPTRFLLDTLDIPVGPGPMSATGKRVIFVEPTTAGDPEILSPEALQELESEEV